MQARWSFELSGRQVHIWTIHTSASSDAVARCEQVLAPDETSRAAQFRLSRARESYIVSRGALRHLLGKYLGQYPARIQLEYGSNGKPALAADSGLQFNVTHSGDIAAVALTAGCDIGVDLEQVRPLPDLEQIAERFLCSDEAAEINSLAAGEREKAFFTYWTRKEAYVKATGIGLSTPLQSFRVIVNPEAPANLVVLEHEATPSKSWTLHDLCLAPDYAGAVAYGDEQRPVSIFPIIDFAQLINIA
jgi:4'-phosphopantetheinyl transferase